MNYDSSTDMSLINPPKITQNLVESNLSNLIYGVNCKNLQPLFTKPKGVNIIYAKDGQEIDALKNKGVVFFFGRILIGGIYDAKSDIYISDDREFSYKLENNTLIVSAMCEKYSFSIKNFDKNNANLGIKLATKPKKEIGICICANAGITKYIEAFKGIAPFVANHIFNNDDLSVFSKIVFVSSDGYAYVNKFGIFYNSQNFGSFVKDIKIQKDSIKFIGHILMAAMRNFTKDNLLKKEIILMAEGDPKDVQESLDETIMVTKNLNANIAKNDSGCYDNCVKVHIFTFKKGLSILKQVATSTGGNYYEIDNILDFKKNFLELCNDGKAVDPKEYATEIHYHKTHKMHDPDDPDDNPPK